MPVDLTLFLLRASVAQLDAVVPGEKRGVDGFEPVLARPDFGSGLDIACWVKKKEPQPLGWSDWLEEGFDFGERRPESQSSGCVVAVRTSGRIFAVSFGTGHHAVPDELIEPDFGLTVALNEVNPKQLRAMVTKSIDVRTRQRDTRHVVGTDVPDFALDLDVEWLRSAEGRTLRDDCKVVAGAHSLHLRGWNRKLSDLPGACDDFLAIFSRGVPEVFRFADSVKRVHENDVLHAQLEADLYAALQLRYFDILSVGVDAKLAHEARRCLLTYDTREWSIDDLDEASLKHGLDHVYAHNNRFDPAKVRLRLVDAEGDRILDERLDRLAQMEIDRDGAWYVRIERQWFRCSEDYVARIREQTAALPDVTSVLALPPWNKRVHQSEEDYNADVAALKGWLLQDQMFWYSQSGEPVEPCDLLTKERQFIHVKDGSTSHALSHLFGQASGAADLLHRHQPFICEMKSRYESKWSDTAFERAGVPAIVLAIARPANGDLFGKMLLSRINVLEHARRVRSRGFEFAVCRILLS